VLESDRPHLLNVADATPVSEPDISQSGPDIGDYPSSAFTLPNSVDFAPVRGLEQFRLAEQVVHAALRADRRC
jgi:hypothetical protein